MKLVTLAWFAAMLVAIANAPAVTTPSRTPSESGYIYLSDNSDWWSFTRWSCCEPASAKPPRMMEERLFQVAGVSLEWAWREGSLNRDWLEDIQSKFGKAIIVSRGDGAMGREQVCYKTAADSTRVKLIFEHNETFNSFFVLRGGPDWKGSQYCVSSSAVSDGLALTNGLKLGMTKHQVESVLGVPSYTASNKYVYLFHELRTETVPAENEGLEFEINASIELRFSEGKVSYLRATRYEVN